MKTSLMLCALLLAAGCSKKQEEPVAPAEIKAPVTQSTPVKAEPSKDKKDTKVVK